MKHLAILSRDPADAFRYDPATLEAWCVANSKGAFTLQSGEPTPWWKPFSPVGFMIGYWFERQEDAALFKLFWS